MPTFSEQVAAFVAAADYADLPAGDAAAVERSVFDTIGTVLAGRTSAVGEHLAAWARSEPEGGCIVPGTGLRRSAPAAAFATGVFAHADDFDDMGGYGHPSAPIIAALLAAVSHEARAGRTVSGREFAIAYATGFELGVSLCSTGAYDQYERCFHSTPVFGALAAACAVARVMRLDAAQTAHALGIAASGASGLGRSSGTMVKPVHAGQAARAALTAVVAARNGATSAPDVFETKGGFIPSLFGHRAVPLDAIADGLGAPYRIESTVFIKRFPCCGSNHSALSAVERLIEEQGLRADEVRELVVHGMMETSPVLRFPVPASGTTAKFSIQYVLATMLVKHGVGLDDFRDDTISDPEVLAVAARVRTEVMNRWDMRGAAKHRGNPVTVRTTDGRELSAAVARTDMVGGPKTPIPDEDLGTKFLQNAKRALGAERAVTAMTSWRRVAASPDVSRLIEEIA